MELLVIKAVNTNMATLVRTLRKIENRDLDLEVSIKRPNHSGMQINQISLLHIPARDIETLQLDLNDAPFATMTDSISLSERR